MFLKLDQYCILLFSSISIEIREITNKPNLKLKFFFYLLMKESIFLRANKAVDLMGIC